MDRTLIQFYHCNKDIYCFSDYFEHLEYKSGLLYCPACFGRLKFNLLEAPVSIPCPFTNGHNVPCAFNIGSMLGPLHISEDDYSELHIGITDSKGLVYNYTLAGIRRDACGWEQCISVPLVQPDRNGLKEQWDRELEKFSSLDSWAPQRFYEERKFGSSCYGFALSFINHVRAIEAPSEHTFLRDFDGESDLHTGITDTKGVVYNYTKTGVQKDTLGWEKCISVPLVQPDMYSLIDQWDQYLEKFSSAQTWDPQCQRFDEEKHNCYNYTLAFINCVLATQDKRALSKDEFTQNFVVPRIKRASKYRMLCEEISRNYFYIVDSPPKEPEDGNSERSF
ncbi:hypothetical protein ANANG_G00248160 [Anguilla anguilla]|uniref:MKRN2 opposite strand protein-like C-terminal domain-containing protein n=1 Tax=Anguilla anguilla TaxID=7936 RepID=A0A9D3RMA2_ANGAN|nr:hypothetical protein ANANG_G00248160 [Anguilla anguilla]